jgi:hypothetical protein
MKVRGIQTIHHGPGSVEVRNQSFRWGQSLASVLWVVIAVNLWATSPGPGLAVVAGVLVAASLLLFFRTIRSGIVRLDGTGAEVIELNSSRHLEPGEIQWFSTQSASRSRENLTIRLQGDDTVVVRWIYSTRLRNDTGKTAVRQAADDLNQVLWDLRADDSSGDPAP